MPLRPVTPSFTVEYRQAKRPNAESVKPGWAHAKPPPAGVDEKAIRIAISAFKTVAAHPPTDVVSPSILPGRILASLVEAGPATRLPDAGGAQSRSYGVAADGAVTRELGERIYSGESCEPSVAAMFQLKQPATSDPSATKAGMPRLEKRTRRPAEKRAKFDHASSTSADMSKTPPMSSTSGSLPVDKPSSISRTSRILDRYVFRDERGPGESWKRRIEVSSISRS
jgi:hypothetical protein